MDIGGFAAEALELLPVPFVALDAVTTGPGMVEDLRVIWANPSARQVFGEGIHGAWLDRDQPFGSMESIVEEAAGSRRDGGLRVVQRTVERGGSVTHLRCTFLPVAIGSAVILEDATAEVQARAEMALMGSTLERVERWGNLGVWEIDLDAGTVYWSTQVYEILGVDEQCLGSFHQVVHPDDRAIVDHVINRLVEQPGPYRVTHRIIRGDEVRTLEQHMQSVPDGTGRPVRLLGTVIDVTATRALQQQVHHSQQLRTVGRLAGGMAHDLANALLIMRGHADALLARSDLDDDARESLAAIARGGERASTLTRRFMALGRHDELRPVRVNPRDVLEDVLGFIGPTLRTEPLDVSIEETDQASSVHVLADADRLRQVILDLVFNARDANASSIELTVREAIVEVGDPACTDHGLAPGRYGVIGVVDDGAGIDPVAIERIFDPFFTTKDADTGSGLGLANAQDFARQSLGTILVASTPGAGTTMSILLPATVATAPASRRRVRRRARRVLVAAPPDRCGELSEILAGADAQMVCMQDLDGLLYSLETEPIDVVVLDEELVPPSAWPTALSGVHVVVVTSGRGAHPQAIRQVRAGDAGGLLQALDELFSTSSA